MNTGATDSALERLEQTGAAALRGMWLEIKGAAPPATITARLMRLALAWDLQAKQEGWEPARIRKRWNAVIKMRSKGMASSTILGHAMPTASVGTRLLKEWGGITHEVTVLHDGVLWNDQTYTSLSAVARAMTGTNRNGPRFFGLRDRATP